jgi:hypothetical protein
LIPRLTQTSLVVNTLQLAIVGKVQIQCGIQFNDYVVDWLKGVKELLVRELLASLSSGNALSQRSESVKRRLWTIVAGRMIQPSQSDGGSEVE